MTKDEPIEENINIPIVIIEDYSLPQFRDEFNMPHFPVSFWRGFLWYRKLLNIFFKYNWKEKTIYPISIIIKEFSSFIFYLFDRMYKVGFGYLFPSSEHFIIIPPTISFPFLSFSKLNTEITLKRNTFIVSDKYMTWECPYPKDKKLFISYLKKYNWRLLTEQ